MKINSISFILRGYDQEFRFKDSAGKWHSALLQLPLAPDSQNSIDGETWEDDAEKDAICEALADFYYRYFQLLGECSLQS